MLDVPKFLSKLRSQRMMMVQTLSQYTFIYKVIIQHLRNSRLIWARVCPARLQHPAHTAITGDCSVASAPGLCQTAPWGRSGMNLFTVAVGIWRTPFGEVLNRARLKKWCVDVQEWSDTKLSIKTYDLPLNSIIYYFLHTLLLNEAQHFYSTLLYIMNQC